MREFLKGCILVGALLTMMMLCFIGGFMLNGVSSGRFGGASSADAPPEVSDVATPPANFGIFYEALGMLREEFYGDLPQEEQVSYAAIRGVLRRLGDPNTILVEPEDHDREQAQFQGEFGGIGLEISLNEFGQVIVVAPVPETPAARANLQADDILIEADGEALFGKSLDEVNNLLKGEVGSTLTLLVFREGEREPFEVSLVRETIPDITVRANLIPNSDVVYIAVSFFSARTPEELRATITQLQAEGAQKFVLDLRNNPGGVLDAAIESASLFLPKGTVVASQRMRDGSEEALTSAGKPLLPDAPLVVLINGGSASASEILAGALHDHGRAQLVGETSFGKGTVQIPYTLSDGSSLHVTIAHWLTPSGIDLTQNGLTPDRVILPDAAALEAGDDNVLDTAVEMLQAGDS